MFLGVSTISYSQDTEHQRTDLQWIQDHPIDELPGELSTFTDEIDVTEHINLTKRHILETFTQKGYFAGRIDSVVHSDKGQYNIYSTLGDQFILSELSINYSDSLADVEGYQSRLNMDTPFTLLLIESEIERIIRHYENEGFPLVAVQLDYIEPDMDTHEVNLSLTVNDNGQMRASGIRTSRLTRNDLEYLERASGVRYTDIITPEMMRNVRRNLENTGLFEYVGEPNILVQDDNHYLYFDVTERSTNAFDILLGYVPQSDGANSVVGTGRIRVRNAIWQGSSLDMSFDRIQQGVTKLNLAFHRNWIMDLPLGMGGNFNFHQQDTSYQIRNIGLKSTWAFSSTFSLSGSLRRETTSSSSNPNLQVTVFNGNATFAGIGLYYHNVDFRNNPTQGREFHVNLETGIKQTNDTRASQYTPNRRIRQQEIELVLRSYYNPFHRQVLAVRTSGLLMDSPEFTESDLFRFGGAKSIRGYREDQFLASRVVWGDLEYRYLLDRDSYAFIFGAYGVYHRPQLITEIQSNNKHTGTLQSWGFGFSYATPIGFMQFSYALSPEDPVTNGKIHFGITKDF